MKMKILGTLIIASTLSSPAFADYNHQITGSYTSAETDFSLDILGVNTDFSIDTDITRLRYNYYFDTVKSDKGPYQINEFLDPSHQIAVSYTDVDIDADIEIDSSFGVFGKYVFDNGIVVRLAYEEEPEAYSANIGYYLSPTSQVNLTVSDCDNNCDTTADVSYRRYQKLSGETGLDFAIAYNDIGEDFDSLVLAADYYFSKQFSIGAIAETDFDNNNAYGINAGYWFQQNFGINIGYATSDDDENNVDVDIATISGQFRF